MKTKCGAKDKLSLQNPNILFVLTNKSNIIRDNILHIENIVSYPNLNEISYFSKFCDIIIGFPSGPYVFTMIKDNLFDKNKTFMTISTNIYDSYYFESKSKMIHINNLNEIKI